MLSSPPTPSAIARPIVSVRPERAPLNTSDSASLIWPPIQDLVNAGYISIHGGQRTFVVTFDFNVPAED